MGLLGLLKKLKKSDNEARILVLRLDNSGKTTILKKMSGEDIDHIMPTQGFNIKSLTQAGFKLNVWDIGGQRTIRPYWRNYFENTDALVYVIDSADKNRLIEAKDELVKLVKEEGLCGVSVLVFLNKQDLMNAQDAGEIDTAVGFDALFDRNYHRTISAKTAEGLAEGFEWLVDQVNDKQEGDEADAAKKK